jgi:two-component system, NtrC family, response regulator HydG
MDAEFIVVEGPLLGMRYALNAEEVRIGQAPTADIRLTGHQVAWEHCVVHHREGRYHIADRRSGTGTYINGMRATEHCLEQGDQVSIGETVLVYRQDARVELADSQNHTLLRACALLFLFRALAVAESPRHRATLAGQLLRLIADIVPVSGGAVMLGRAPEEVLTAARELGAGDHLAEMAARVFGEGVAIDAEKRTMAVALASRGAVAGAIVAQFPAEEEAHLADHRDTLSAIATLAVAALDTARQVGQLQMENAQLLERLGTDEAGVVGESPSMGKLRQMIARVAPLDTSVLILGESGTGKELVARSLQRQSPRAAKPFIAINCAAITETLLESELFGHEKGAFTGAVAQKKGKLELGEGGTVFLDEIGELAAPLQAKLLRVLQQREFERVGGTTTHKLDVRLIAATNVDLAAAARQGKFREDLYHRLNVVALRVPPLRDRAADIPALARHFLERSSARCHRRVSAISPEAERYLMSYSWPGNVRELENAIERAVVLGESGTLLPEDLPETVLEAALVTQVPGALQDSVIKSKRQLILAAWQECGGDHNLAAERLNIHPNSLRRLLRTLHLRETLP